MTYQLPAVVTQSVSLVVSPLIALAKDQVQIPSAATFSVGHADAAPLQASSIVCTLPANWFNTVPIVQTASLRYKLRTRNFGVRLQCTCRWRTGMTEAPQYQPARTTALSPKSSRRTLRRILLVAIP